MKTTTAIIITAMVFFCGFSLSAQETDSLAVTADSIEEPEYPVYELPEIFTTDNNLKLIGQFIPSNWIVTHFGDTLKFRNVSPIYKISDTIAVDTMKKGRGKFKELPPLQPDSAYIIILLEPLWSGKKVDDAKLKNSHTLALIEKLLKKYKITHLKDRINTEDFDINAEDITDDERKSINRYFEDKAKLEKDLVPTPDYHTTLFSLFILHVFPAPDQAILYSPPGIVADAQMIIKLFEKYAGK